MNFGGRTKPKGALGLTVVRANGTTEIVPMTFWQRMVAAARRVVWP